MTRPTDEELEAMAVKLDAIHIVTGVRANRDILGTRPIETANEALREAAALLRACKGRVRVPTRQRLAQIIQGESGHAEEWALGRADDVLAALDPAPSFDDGLEAAEKARNAAVDRDDWLGKRPYQTLTEYQKGYLDGHMAFLLAIRALKGQPHD